ncbi:MAG: DivIVA domain-containing protein, partial [Selenomonadaceae bacterium]|nr:DivIVA domain-containing protein [Selenomonadaceae bacterium]
VMPLLTPMDIHNREFKKGLRGYKESEVDEFLDRVVADYEKLWRDNEKLKEQVRFNEKEISHYRNLERNLQETLVVAQKTADEVVSAAKKNAKEMRENAVRESKNMYDNTVSETQNMRDQAQIDIKQQLEDAQHKLRAIAAEYARLVTEKEALFIRIRTTLESELAVTNQLLNSLPQPEEFSKIQSAAFTSFENNLKAQAITDPKKNSVDEDKKSEDEDDKDENKVDEEDDVKIFERSETSQETAPKSSSTQARNSAQVTKIEQALKSARAASQAKLEAELEKTTAYTPNKRP